MWLGFLLGERLLSGKHFRLRPHVLALFVASPAPWGTRAVSCRSS